MAATKAPAARPLSPHLQIYKPTLTMTMSIVHRITGVGNYFGTLLLAWWFIAAASPSSYAKFEWFAGSIIGRIILFGFTVALFYHFCNGIRHPAWDAGKGYELPTMHRSGVLVFAATIILTVSFWGIALFLR